MYAAGVLTVLAFSVAQIVLAGWIVSRLHRLADALERRDRPDYWEHD